MTRKKTTFVPLQSVTVLDPFFSRIQDTVIRTMIPYQERVLNDEVPDVPASHAIRNYRIAAGLETGTFYGFVFQDSDLAKWLEAVACSLVVHPDKALEERADAWIGLVEAAQQEDGYLNTYFTVAEPEHRWENLADCHELYCAGHMIEAGVAYYQATGKDRLLKVVCRLADHIEKRFAGEGKPGIPGHPEIELALMRLYHLTGERKYLKLAKLFIDRRGQKPDYFRQEREQSSWQKFNYSMKASRYYMQNHLPLREQTSVEGHAVRCMYLLTGAADVAAETEDEELMEACRRLWKNMTERRMYLTGGIGSTGYGEAFTRDFDLPNDSAYAETCASVGVCFFARQMLEAEPSRVYADILERELYNGTISGMQLDGTKFFYINQLEADPAMSGEVYGTEEYSPERIGWYNCACCPPNLARLMTSLGGYLWSVEKRTADDEKSGGENPGTKAGDITKPAAGSEDIIYSHLFIGNRAKLPAAGGVEITLTGNYPWEGDFTYEVNTEAEEAYFTLAIRQPAWCSPLSIRWKDEAGNIHSGENFSDGESGRLCSGGILRGEESLRFEDAGGYWLLRRKWHSGDTVQVHMELPVRRVYADPRVKADAGCVALMRGPVVYAFEGVDNGENLSACRIPKDAEIRAFEYDPDLLEGVVRLEAEGRRAVPADDFLYSPEAPREVPVHLTAIPYYAWCNRGKTQMRVWMRE